MEKQMEEELKKFFFILNRNEKTLEDLKKEMSRIYDENRRLKNRISAMEKEILRMKKEIDNMKSGW